MVKTVLSPLMGDEYDPDVLLEMEDLYQYYKTWMTHERGLVNHFNKRIILLNDGQVIGDGLGSYEV